METSVKPPLPDPLVTPRLALRAFRPDDIDDLYAMDGDARVMRYLANGLPPQSREACAQALVRWQSVHAERPGWGPFHASRRDDGAFVGTCALFHVPDGQDVEIAYRLPVVRWGQGYATEMAGALLQHGFRALGLSTVIGLTWPENVASQRVLERIGMVRAGSGRYYEREMFVYRASRR